MWFAQQVVDFRGYGWSTGVPTLSKIASDGAAIVPHLPELLRRGGLDPSSPLVAFGRSLGSIAAIHAVLEHPTEFVGLVLDSPLCDMRSLPMTRAVVARSTVDGQPLVLGAAGIPDIVDNGKKMSRIRLPLLVVHGEEDFIVPVRFHRNPRFTRHRVSSTTPSIIGWFCI